MNAKGRELLVPFRFPEGEAPAVTRIRSTLITASIQSMRAMGWEARYYAALPVALHAEVQGLIAGNWQPVELGIEHYRACDAMGLTSDEILEVGEDVSRRTQDTFVGTMLRAAAGAGATPWHVYANAHRIWGRMIDGADQCVHRLGPKEAVIQIVRCALLDVPYFRAAVRAYYRAITLGLARVVHVVEERGERRPSAIEMRMSWV